MKTSQSEFSATIFLSLATAPVLIAIGGAQALAQMLTEIGQTSEEIFRGDRLPILHVQDSQPPTSPTYD